jgi:predicted transcriptional regulator
MSAKKADTRESVVLAFLSGRGPNPVPERKHGDAGPLEKKFIDEAMQEIAEQDRANERKAAPSVADTLLAVMRLISDNHEMIQLILSQRVSTISDLAAAMGRELSNVSRTLSKMAAYDLIGFEEDGTDARAKKPVWLLPELPGHEDLDWVQAYCLSMALKKRTAGLTPANFSLMDVVVRSMVESVAEKIEMARTAVPSPGDIHASSAQFG